MITARFITGFCLLVLVFETGCDQLSSTVQKSKEGDILLATVESRKLFYSDIDAMISASSVQDSLAQQNAIIEAWLVRNVVLNEAEKNFPPDLDIDKLIDDYRSSLILHNYRQLLIEKDLDTTITAAQEEEYYNVNKEQYLLAEPICKARIVKIPDKSRRIEGFYRNWQRNDTANVNAYISENAVFDLNMEDEWHTIDHFLSFLPENKFKKRDFSKKGDVQKHDGSLEYFIKVTEYKEKNEIPPLSYVRDQMKKVIINSRKKDLLEQIEKKLYQNYLTSNKIKVFKMN
ncbi:MAG: hypothetical protein AAGA77_08050 [Bacteroidota bacterium]